MNRNRRASCQISAAVGTLLTLGIIVVLIVPNLKAQNKPAAEPHLVSIFPCAGQRGDKVKIEFRGSELDGVYGFWSEDFGLSGLVSGVERAPEPIHTGSQPDSKKAPVYRGFLDLDVPPALRAGLYMLRAITPRGLTNALAFHVTERPIVQEQKGGHASGADAQNLRLPALVAGRLSQPGEVDFYAFQAEAGQQFRFRISMAENFEPRLALYREQPSWFGSGRNPRVLFEEEQSSDLMASDAHGTFRAAQTGRYFLEVSSLFGKGSADATYELEAIASGKLGANEISPRPEREWRERTFTRPLGPAWIDAVVARSVETSGARPNRPVSRVTEHEPNNVASQAQLMTPPALIEGIIRQPGDVDIFRFRVEAGQKLTFEIETPQTVPPHFNPRLGVLDGQGHQVLVNLERHISLFNNNAEPEVYLKAIQPRATYTFSSAGDYLLELRDITARYGSETYAYRILVRPQIPHVGEVSSPDLDHVNLQRGGAKKISVNASLEEGFNGDVYFSLSGLPAGVTASAGGRILEERAPLDLPQNAEMVLPVSYASTLILNAAAGAELSHNPAKVSLHCRPVVNGVPGPDLVVREFPLMLIAVPQPKEKQP
jgi:hypothetical protein